MSNTDTLIKPFNMRFATNQPSIDMSQNVNVAGPDHFVTNKVIGLPHSNIEALLHRPKKAFSTSSSSFGIQDEGMFRPNMGDFAALDYLRTAEGRIEQLIRSIRDASPLIYRERLSRRLEFLLNAMKEEGEKWSEDSPESLRMMMLFLQTVPDFRYPTVTITPSATFRIQWTVDGNRHFAADFLPDGQVKFVVFCPDPHHSSRIQRISGITSRENLINIVKPYKVHDWAAGAGK